MKGYYIAKRRSKNPKNVFPASQEGLFQLAEEIMKMLSRGDLSDETEELISISNRLHEEFSHGDCSFAQRLLINPNLVGGVFGIFEVA